MRRLRSAVAGGFREGTQEAISGIARDISASSIYDPDRPIGDSVVDDFAVGAGAGGIFDFAFSLATGKYKRRAPDDPQRYRSPHPKKLRRKRRQGFVRTRRPRRSRIRRLQRLALQPIRERLLRETLLVLRPSRQVAEKGHGHPRSL